MRPCLITLALALLLLSGCDGEEPAADAGGEDAGGATVDAGGATDAGPGADTWTSFASDFMQTYCVECHASSPRDFNELADVRASAAVMRCGVSDVMLSDCGPSPRPQQFPVGTGPIPTDEERARIVAWLDAGAPE